MKRIPAPRLLEVLRRANKKRVLVIGDLMLDQYLFGSVSRISPEAPVPVVQFEREALVPGGAANVARNLTAIGANCSLFGIIGQDENAKALLTLLQAERIECSGVLMSPRARTTLKTRIIAHQQQVLRVDREQRSKILGRRVEHLLSRLEPELNRADAVVVADYGKGAVTQYLLNRVKSICSSRKMWISLDPKPVSALNLSGLSLLTPNRKEAFELANIDDLNRSPEPLNDRRLLMVAKKLLKSLGPRLLLITLGEQGMLLCESGSPPIHIPTAAREVFDVSGAGDTVIATFTLAIATGATPLEAAIVANHAAGVVVAKVGTATATAEEINASFRTRGKAPRAAAR